MELTMYDILEDRIEQLQEISANGGEVTPEFDAELAIGKENYREKMECYIKAVKNYKALADAIAEEKNKLDAKKKAAENVVDKLKSIMITAMETFDSTKDQFGIFKVYLKETESVSITDEEAVPQEYKKPKYEVCKNNIKDAIKNGVEVNGAEIVTTKYITIK